MFPQKYTKTFPINFVFVFGRRLVIIFLKKIVCRIFIGRKNNFNLLNWAIFYQQWVLPSKVCFVELHCSEVAFLLITQKTWVRFDSRRSSKIVGTIQKGSVEMDLGRFAVRGKVVAPSLEKLLNRNQSGNIFSPPFNKIAKKNRKEPNFFFQKKFYFCFSIFSSSSFRVRCVA